MRRRQFIGLLGAAATAWPLTVRAQQRMRRIGVLMAFAASDPEAQLRVKAFEAGLRELGWAPGRNLTIDYRWALGDANLLRVQAAELIAAAPDLILAASTPVLAALRKESTSQAMVFVQVTDPIEQGFVSSLARPGGNLTGFTNFEFPIGTKWLETLKQVAPQVKRVAVLFNPETAPFAPKFVRPIADAAPAFAVEPFEAVARDPGEILVPAR